MPAEPGLLADYVTFTGCEHFIEVYLSVDELIRTAEDSWMLTYEVAGDLAPPCAPGRCPRSSAWANSSSRTG